VWPNKCIQGTKALTVRLYGQVVQNLMGKHEVGESEQFDLETEKLLVNK